MSYSSLSNKIVLCSKYFFNLLLLRLVFFPLGHPDLLLLVLLVAGCRQPPFGRYERRSGLPLKNNMADPHSRSITLQYRPWIMHILSQTYSGHAASYRTRLSLDKPDVFLKLKLKSLFHALLWSHLFNASLPFLLTPRPSPAGSPPTRYWQRQSAVSPALVKSVTFPIQWRGEPWVSITCVYSTQKQVAPINPAEFPPPAGALSPFPGILAEIERWFLAKAADLTGVTHWGNS